MRRIARNDPERLYFSRANAIDDFVVGYRVLRGNTLNGNIQHARYVRAVLGLQEITSANRARDVGVEARAHRIALAGDAICAGSGPPDVTGHQCEVDDGLRSARGFVALIHAHRPPK